MNWVGEDHHKINVVVKEVGRVPWDWERVAAANKGIGIAAFKFHEDAFEWSEEDVDK